MADEEDPAPRCFVIGPIGDQHAEPMSDGRRAYEDAIQVYEEVIVAACAELGIETYRSDEMVEAGEINEQIIRALRDEPLVIADLSGANPNVMYELGIRHTTRHVTIQLAERSDRQLPFDVSTIRTILFARTPNGLVKAKRQLREAIGSTLASGRSASAVSRVFSDAGSTETLAPHPPEDDEPDEEPGTLEVIADMEDSLPGLLDRLQELNSLTGQIGELASAMAPRASSASTSRQRLAVVQTFATALDPLVDQFDRASVEFQARVRTVGAGLFIMFAALEAGDEEVPADVRDELLANLATMSDAASEALDVGMRGFYESLGPLANISSQLRRPVTLLRNALARTMDDFQVVVTWGTEAVRLQSVFRTRENAGSEA